MSPRHLIATALVGLLLATNALPAWAGDERPVELPLVSGKTLKGIVKQIQDGEVVLGLEGGKTRRISWAHLTPVAVYRVKAALAPVADGEARRKLAELAADLGLYKQARLEYEKALALDAIKPAEFQTLVAAAESHAVKAGVNHAKKLAEAGDLEAALDIATGLRLHFASAPNAKEVGKLIRQLLTLVEKLDKEATKAQAELDKAMVDLSKNKEIIRRRTEAQKQYQKGLVLAKASKTAQSKGQVSRARKRADSADEEFGQARRNLGRLRRILPRRSKMRREVLAELVQLDKAQFDLLHAMAWFMWESRVYSRAEQFAARASYIDPVHPQLMELRDELVSSRIRYRLSDMTNARGRIR